MIDVLLQTLPFFALIGLGFGAAARGFFPPEATAYLTRFVFYFALSAMLFRFSANLSLAEVISWPFIWAYALGGLGVYILATVVALVRKRGAQEAAVEAQCAVIGNTGFLGVPMLALLLGEAAIPAVMLVLAVDLFLFSSLIVIIITGTRDGRVSPAVLGDRRQRAGVEPDDRLDGAWVRVVLDRMGFGRACSTVSRPARRCVDPRRAVCHRSVLGLEIR